jgi:adenosylcobinamide-phosphate synthase
VLIWPDALLVLLGALVIDAVAGDPVWLWRRLPHPVTLIGAVIAALDRRFNRADRSFGWRRGVGLLCLAGLVLAAALIGASLELALRSVDGGKLLIALIAAIFLAQRSLYDHVAAVYDAFVEGGLEQARRAVAMIVGRDPAALDEAGVCRAAIESCAENFSDGVVAPAFWFALLGLPGLLIYKVVNTADSMIGHRTARHEAFGWAAARLDDVLNLVPARLSGLLIGLAAPMAKGQVASALRVMVRDARLHRSPNAGWPESAMAGALQLALAGPRRYAERTVDDPFLNAAGRKDASPDDIRRALRILIAASVLHAAAYAALVVLI